MNDKAAPETLVGRGNRDGAELFRKWFASLTDVANDGGQAAYVLSLIHI